VKTHVERDRDDPRYIITTYYGVHNHAVPGSGAPAAPDLWPLGDAAPCRGSLVGVVLLMGHF